MNTQLIARMVKAYRQKDNLYEFLKRGATKEEKSEVEKQLREIRLAEKPIYFR